MVTNEAVVGAIRLALVGAANSETAMEVVQALVDQAPQTPAQDLESPRLLLKVLNALNGTFAVNQVA